MREVTIEEAGRLAADARERIWAEARKFGREPKIYLHWSAGTYTALFEDYHINITGEGEIFISTEDFSEVLPHTYMRNTGGVGIALACAYGATTDYLGTFPPTPEQIEVMAQTIAAVADGLWLTIDKEHVMTHGEAADNEDGLALHELYGPQHGCERWDLEYLGIPESPGYDPWAVDGSRGGDVLRGKANWYRQQKMNKGVY